MPRLFWSISSARLAATSIPFWLFVLSAAFLALDSTGAMHGTDPAIQIKGAMQLVRTGSPALKVDPNEPSSYWNSIKAPNGLYYEMHDIGNSLLMAPTCFVVNALHRSDNAAKPLFTLFTCLVYPIGVIYAYLLFGLFYSKRTSLVLTGIYVFGTPFIAYARTSLDIMEGAVALVPFIYHFMRLAKVDPSDPGLQRDAVMLGLWLGVVGNFRYSVAPAFCVSALLLFFLNRGTPGAPRRAALFLGGFLAAMLPTFYFNYVRMGNPLMPATIAPQFRIPILNAMTSNPLKIFPLQFLSPNYGMVFFCPLILLLPFAPKSLRTWPTGVRAGIACLMLGAGLYVVEISRMSNWNGQWGWGSRYMVPIYLIFLLAVAPVMINGAGRLSRVGKVLAALSVLINMPTMVVDWINCNWYDDPFGAKLKAEQTIKYPYAIEPRVQMAAWSVVLKGLHGEPAPMDPKWLQDERLRSIEAFPDSLIRRAAGTHRGKLIALAAVPLLILIIAGSGRKLWLLSSSDERPDETDDEMEPGSEKSD